MAVRLSAWIDGELDAAAAAEVREHLGGCASCQRRYALLTAASTLVRRLPAETVSAGFEDAFRRRLATSLGVAANPGRRRWTTIAAAGLAAVLVLAALGSLALRQTFVPGEARTARSNDLPGWVVTRGAPAASEPELDTPCASALVCGAPAPADAPCATAATCGAPGGRPRTREGS